MLSIVRALTWTQDPLQVSLQNGWLVAQEDEEIFGSIIAANGPLKRMGSKLRFYGAWRRALPMRLRTADYESATKYPAKQIAFLRVELLK